MRLTVIIRIISVLNWSCTELANWNCKLSNNKTSIAYASNLIAGWQDCYKYADMIGLVVIAVTASFVITSVKTSFVITAVKTSFGITAVTTSFIVTAVTTNFVVTVIVTTKASWL